ncbi:MAG TPA: DNA-binding response regulator [Clostridiales bacterium]|nr:DNA-binding response regulator [Clostridiales bacterium]
MVFCVEDDETIRELVVYALKSSGFDAVGFAGGKAFTAELTRRKPDLVLLDIMMPGDDGISLLKQLRSDPSTRAVPVIMLSARGAEFDKVMCLDQGADDYITKPFGVMELISRVKAVLRRTSGGPRSEDAGRKDAHSEEVRSGDEIRSGSILIQPDRHSVTVDDREIPLTLKEFELLRQLLQNTGKVLTRERLLDLVWGFEFGGETRTVDVHVASLRQKLGESGKRIRTIRGVGYSMGGGG